MQVYQNFITQKREQSCTSVFNGQYLCDFNGSLSKQLTFCDTTSSFPAKWRLRNERRNSILMTRHYPDLGSASDWSCRGGKLLQPIKSTTQIRPVTRHQCGISIQSFLKRHFARKPVMASRMSAVFSDYVNDIENRDWEWLQFRNVLIESCRFEGEKEYEIQLKVGVPVLKKGLPGKLHFTFFFYKKC